MTLLADGRHQLRFDTNLITAENNSNNHLLDDDELDDDDLEDDDGLDDDGLDDEDLDDDGLDEEIDDFDGT